MRELWPWLVMAALGSPLVFVDPLVASRVLLGAIGVSATVFVVLYAARSDWRSTHVGRSLMACAATVAAIAGHATVTVLFGGDYPGRLLIRAVLFYGLWLGIVHMTWTLWRTTDVADEESAGGAT